MNRTWGGDLHHFHKEKHSEEENIKKGMLKEKVMVKNANVLFQASRNTKIALPAYRAYLAKFESQFGKGPTHDLKKIVPEAETTKEGKKMSADQEESLLEAGQKSLESIAEFFSSL